MTTFTLRVSDSLAEGLSSAKMRASLDNFLCQPHPLPWDPGPGHERISLTLTEADVNAAAAYLRCSASSALRRIATDGNRAPSQTAIPDEFPSRTPAPATVLWTISNPASPPEGMETAPQDSASRGPAIAGALVQILCSVLFMGIWLFFISRKKAGLKEA